VVASLCNVLRECPVIFFFEFWVCSSFRIDERLPAVFWRRERYLWWLGPAVVDRGFGVRGSDLHQAQEGVFLSHEAARRGRVGKSIGLVGRPTDGGLQTRHRSVLEGRLGSDPGWTVPDKGLA
jgi:hypothetical protein